MTGEEIRQRRQALKLSLRELEAYCGVGYVSIFYAERGGSVAPATRSRVVKALDILERNQARLQRELAAIRAS